MHKFQKPENTIARRQLLKTGLGTLLAGGVASSSLAASTPANNVRQRRPIIIDGLGGLSNNNLMFQPDAVVVDKGIDERALSDAHASGLTAVNITMGFVAGDHEPFEYSVREVAKWDALIRRKPEHLVKILTARDIRQAHENGKIGIIFGFQNAAMMGDDASRVEIFADLGVRVIQLTYNVGNQLGDGSMMPENRGLTEFGHDVVSQLNANNILVDLSHSGEQICLDAIAASQQPISINHTGCRAVADLPRNKSDRELRLLADKGGVAGMYFMPFLAVGRQAFAEDLMRHIDHAINICGEDHVGIGTDGSLPAIDDMPAFRAEVRKDIIRRRAAGISATGETFDIVPMLPDLNGKDKFFDVADMMVARGHSAARIDKILGGNFLRLKEAIWQG